MKQYFRWKNCFADVLSHRYGSIAQAFLCDVVDPSLDALTRQIQHLSSSEDPTTVFAIAHIQELEHSTTQALCLAIQSLWERQIREYLVGCARELKANERISEKAKACKWEQLDGVFRELRGLSLSDFQQYSDLNFLQLLGNACRHGEGSSMMALWKAHPELWPRAANPPSPLPHGIIHRFEPTMDSMVVPRGLLRQFIEAISSFWKVVEYIFDESIERKHESLEQRMADMRLTWAGAIAPNRST